MRIVETTVVPYLVRLLAFLIFLGAIVDKNLSTRRSNATEDGPTRQHSSHSSHSSHLARATS